jgi:5'-nucleotidase
MNQNSKRVSNQTLDLRTLGAAVMVAAMALGIGACSDDDDASPVTTAPATTVATPPVTTEVPAVTEAPVITDAPVVTDAPATTEPAAPTALRILLVNDDGVENPAIDFMLALLLSEPDVDVTVVAPAEERSGTSDSLTEGGVEYREATTPGGVPAYAVEGFPADSVIVALDELGLDPHLVLSGVNPGQNIGPFAALSGTVGVGRTAIRRGYPALAVSAGLQIDTEQFEFAANLALEWIRVHREALIAGTHQTDTVTSINVPACAVDLMGPLTEVPRATEFPEGANPFESTCDQSDPAPADDAIALIAGYPTITLIPPDLD